MFEPGEDAKKFKIPGDAEELKKMVYSKSPLNEQDTTYAIIGGSVVGVCCLACCIAKCVCGKEEKKTDENGEKDEEPEDASANGDASEMMAPPETD